MATEEDVFWEILYFGKQTQVIQLLSRSRPNHLVQMQTARWSKLGRTISGSVDKGDTELVSP